MHHAAFFSSFLSLTFCADAIASDIVAVAGGERPSHRRFYGSGSHVPKDPGITVGQYASAVNKQLELEVRGERWSCTRACGCALHPCLAVCTTCHPRRSCARLLPQPLLSNSTST
jgi:hypothetical protein